MKKYPKALFVKWEDGGTGPEYLNANTEIVGLIEMGRLTKIGVYRLVETQDIRGVPVRVGKKAAAR